MSPPSRRTIRWLGAKTISLKELAEYPIITTTRNTNARTVLERALHELHQTVQPAFELVHHLSVGKMVEAGLGVTLLPRSAVGSMSSARIVTVELKPPRIFRELGLITRREYQFSPAAQAFVTVLKQFFAKSGVREEGPAKPRKPARNRPLVAVNP